MLVYRSEDILHFKNFSIDGLKGKSISYYLNEIITNEQRSIAILREKYKTGLQDPLVVKYIGDLNEARTASIKKKFENLGGVKNAGKVVPIPSEFDVKQIETKLVNNQFFQLQGLTTRQIANAFGIKSFQLNDMEKSTYNNVEQQNKAFYTDTLQNALTEYEQEMNYKLLRKDQMALRYFKFNVDSILRSDLQTRMDAYTKAVAGMIMTSAEARAKEDLPFIAGTDRLVSTNGASLFFDDIGVQYNSMKGGGNNE